MLDNSADNRIREAKLLLKSGRGSSKLIKRSKSQKKFEEIRGTLQCDRHGVGWNHFQRWPKASSPVRAALVVQERLRRTEFQKRSNILKNKGSGLHGMKPYKDLSRGGRFGACHRSDWPLSSGRSTNFAFA